MKNYLSLICVYFLLVSCSSESTDSNNNDSVLIVSDIDGNQYDLIEICDGKKWTKQNLNVTKYRNGDNIPQVQDPVQWSNLTTGAWCYYANLTENGVVYGKLYNWYAVNDSRGLAPEGTRIPTRDEWIDFAQCLGYENAGGKMKSVGTSLWMAPNEGATNESSFSALPAGLRNNSGTFVFLTKNAYWWSITENNSTTAKTRSVTYNVGGVSDYSVEKRSGLSVRCIK